MPTTPRKKCLIVDDDESIRGYLKAILEGEQFHTLEAEDGIEGLRLVETLEGGLDLIVSDIQMPGGDGLVFVRAVRESFPALPVVLVSGHSGPRQHTLPGASFEYVKKPFLPETLLTAVETAMKARISGAVRRSQSHCQLTVAG